MDTANLKTFIKVAETGSFTTAADSLFVTQPAISKRIGQLEEQFGSKLLDRKNKQIQLTQTGQTLLSAARQILFQIETVSQQIADMENRPMGRVTLATSHHIGLHRLPPVIRAFSARYPAVELNLNFMDSEQACQSITANELELAIVTLPFEKSPKLELIKIWDDKLMIICSPEHPLSELQAPVLEDLIKHPAILPSHGTFTRQAIGKAFHKVQGDLTITLETNYLETIKMMVSVGLGWSILPASMLDKSLHELQIPGFFASRELGIVLNKNRSRSKAVSALVALLKSES